MQIFKGEQVVHLYVPVLEVSEMEPLSLTIFSAELKWIVNNFTVKNTNMRNSIFVGHVLIILQVLGIISCTSLVLILSDYLL